MKAEINDLVAYRGYYCADCIKFNSRIAALAGELATEMDRSSFDEYFEVKSSCATAAIEDVGSFRDYQVFKKVLNTLRNQACHTPCRSGEDGCGDECPIKLCVLEKGLRGCWECDDYESCDKAGFVAPFWGGILQRNIELIRRYGPEEWLAYRPKGYVWLE